MNRKRSLSKRLSRHDPDDAEFDAAVAEFHNGSDRVAAIMGAALIENSLMKAIEASLENRDDTSALFFDESAPFGTFKRRIVAGHALGLYDKHVAADLDYIRDIRNQFAHALLSLDFSNPDIADACKKIREYHYHIDTSRTVGDVRRHFEIACWSITLQLTMSARRRLEERVQKLGSDKVLNALIASGLQRGTNDVLSGVSPNEPAVKD